MFKIVFILLLICQSAFAQLIDDLPHKKIEKAILFTGTDSIIKTHQGLIKAMPDVQFLVFVSSILNEKETREKYIYPNADIKFLDYPITSWAQDRILRMQGVISGVPSEHMYEVSSIYETVVVKEASYLLGLPKDENSSDYWISKYTGKDPFVLHSFKAGYLPSNQSNLFYGDGGDRLVTSEYILLGGNSLVNIKKQHTDTKIEDITKKKLIEIDTAPFDRYAFHLDTFLTFISDKEIIMGSYNEALNILPENLNWVDYTFMKKKSQKEQAIIKLLQDIGFNITLIPLVYKKEEGLISFNNGVFDLNNFYLSNYDFKDNDIDKWINILKDKSKEAYLSKGINPHFIEGGENNISLGGQVRCTMAVIFKS
jgi:hypothetical protein